MPVLLLANVGNRDVWVDRSAPVPIEINPHADKDVSRRALGVYLTQQWAACQSYLSLPIIGKAVDYARQQSGDLDRVILISSDQSNQEGVAERHLAQDTCELAPVVQRLLVERYNVPGNAIVHWAVRDNPADYGVMQRFLRDRLSALRADEPDGVFFLEVSGGTPAMTSMLLTVGAEVLGLAAHPLYVSEREDQPFPLDLGRRLVAESLIRTIRANLDIYAYHAAANTVRDNADLLREFVSVEPLLGILEYAYQRRNFSFKDAWQALDAIADSPWHQAAVATAEGMCEHERAWVLREGIYAAQIADQLGQYFEFVTRVFQFAEGMLRFLALELGVEFIKNETDQSPDPDGKSISQDWQERHSALVANMRSTGINIEYGANRQVMKAIVEGLGTPDQRDRCSKALEILERLEKISELRNRVVHCYHRVTPEFLRDTFYPKKRDQKRHSPEDAVRQIVSTMEEVWSRITGQFLSPNNPYTAVNRLIEELLAA